MSYLVDTNVLCEATRKNADKRVLEWLNDRDSELHVSVITLGEILKGIHLLPNSTKKRKLMEWFVELRSGLEGRILSVDQEVMAEWASLYARNQKAGRLLSSFDSLLAATASVHDLTVATRNESDFPTDVRLINPWEA